MKGPPSISAGAGAGRRRGRRKRGPERPHARPAGRGGDEPCKRHGVAVQGRHGGGRQLRQRRARRRGRPGGRDVVVDPPVRVQRTDAQARGEALHEALIRPERLGQRACLGAAVACEQRGGRPSVQHHRAQPVGVAGGVGERDAAAVAGGVELDVVGSELGPDGIEIGRRGAGAVRVAPIADAAGAPVPRASTSTMSRRSRSGSSSASSAARFAEVGTPSLPALTSTVSRAFPPRGERRPRIRPDGAGRGIGGDERHRDRSAASAAARPQVARRAAAGSAQSRGEGHDRHPRTRRGYQRSPHPAQLGSQRCSNESAARPSRAPGGAPGACARTRTGTAAAPAEVAFVPFTRRCDVSRRSRRPRLRAARRTRAGPSAT